MCEKETHWLRWWVCSGKMTPQVLVIAAAAEPQQMAGVESFGWGLDLHPVKEAFGSVIMP